MAYVPNNLYVGFRADGEDTLTCFMTPLANDSAFAKRKKTIDDWSSKEMSCTEITNEPRNGFRLVDTSRRWNSNNVVFRVIHPEIGAEFEISAENLSTIMGNSDILKGEIQEKLLLIREGSKNILVIEGSDSHLGASSVDENGKELFLKKNEYNVGDFVSVKGIGKVVYLGRDKVHTTELEYRYNFQSYRMTEETHTGHILFKPSENKAFISDSVPKVLKKYESTQYQLTDLIGAYVGYGDRCSIYDVGEYKGSDMYEWKMVPSTIGYGYAFISQGNVYEIVYLNGKQYSVQYKCTIKDGNLIDASLPGQGYSRGGNPYGPLGSHQVLDYKKVLK